jgi:hypothetical protein
VFRVRAANAVGQDPTEATRGFAIDTSPPQTTISSGRSGASADRSASFTFSASEEGASFECRLDRPDAALADWTACSSPRAYDDLADGAYVFRVRAIDALGNIDPYPPTRSFTVATSQPTSNPQTPPPDTIPQVPPPSTPTPSGAAVAYALKKALARWSHQLTITRTAKLAAARGVDLAFLAPMAGKLSITLTASIPTHAMRRHTVRLATGAHTFLAGRRAATSLRPTVTGRRILRRDGKVTAILTTTFLTSNDHRYTQKRRIRLSSATSR